MTCETQKDYKIEIKNSILDNVHGFIGLTEVENQIEKLPIFKRLQNISQLGLSHRIFPCALHNRYIHSLGVMYIVDQMAIKLGCFTDNERQLLRLAGMLHDIGHYPLSHDIEMVYKKLSNITHTVDSSKIFSSFKQNTLESINNLEKQDKLHDLRLSGHPEKSLHHENVGVLVLKSSNLIKEKIKKYYVDNNSFFDTIDNPVERIIDEIAAIITGNAQYKNSLFPKRFSIMVQLMHSEIDADRIDYLLRDATFTGASYGSFDLGMLVQTLEYTEYNDTPIVGVNLKGIGCAEQFLINRYLAYNQVINHKYTSIIGCIVQAIVSWLISDPSTGYIYSNITQLIKTHDYDTNQVYLHFTDSSLMSLINQQNDSNPAIPQEIRILLRCLKQYQAFDLSSEDVVVDNKPANIAKVLRDSTIFQRMINCDDDNMTNIYQYREVILTSHESKTSFEKKLARSRKSNDAKLLYRIDRLQEGAAVIEDRKDPYLLIDTKRSMLHKLQGVKYSILREYNFDRFK